MYIKSRVLMIKQKLDLISKLENIFLKHLSFSCGIEEMSFIAVGTINRIIKYANSVS